MNIAASKIIDHATPVRVSCKSREFNLGSQNETFKIISNNLANKKINEKRGDIIVSTVEQRMTQRITDINLYLSA